MPVKDKKVKKQDWIGRASDKDANLITSWPTPWRALGKRLPIRRVPYDDKVDRL